MMVVCFVRNMKLILNLFLFLFQINVPPSHSEDQTFILKIPDSSQHFRVCVVLRSCVSRFSCRLKRVLLLF